MPDISPNCSPYSSVITVVQIVCQALKASRFCRSDCKPFTDPPASIYGELVRKTTPQRVAYSDVNYVVRNGFQLNKNFPGIQQQVNQPNCHTMASGKRRRTSVTTLLTHEQVPRGKDEICTAKTFGNS